MPTQVISGSIRTPDDVALEDVTVIAMLKPVNSGLEIDHGGVVTGRVETTTDSGGEWSLTLERNNNIQPSGTFWEITQKVKGVYGGEVISAIVVGDSDATLQQSIIASAPAVAPPELVSFDTGDARWGTPDELAEFVAEAQAAAVSASESAEEALQNVLSLFTAPSQILISTEANQADVMIQSYNVKAFGAVGDGETDDTVAIQAAIDTADSVTFNPTYGPGWTGAPNVYFPPGSYFITDELTWRGCNLVGDWPTNSAVIVWGGSTGATVINKAVSDAGGNSYCHLKGLSFASADNEPETWVAYPAMNDMNIIEYCEFNSCSGDALTVGGWVKGNWHNIRWNEIGGYAISLDGTIARASFSIADFHYGHNRASGNGKGFINVVNPGSDDLGQIRLCNGRLELNTGWSGNKAIINYDNSAAVGSAPLVMWNVDSVVLATDVPLTGYVLLYQDGQSQAVALDVREFTSVLPAILGGDLPAGFPPLTGKGTWQHLLVQAWGAYGAFGLSDATDIGLVFYRNGTTVPTRAFQYFVNSEANPRLVLDPVTGIAFGSGGASPTDVSLEWLAPGFLTSKALRLTDRLQLQKISDPGNTSANIGQIFLQDNGSGKMQLCARFPSGAAVVLATEP
jgi:hypothetical protein